jgi:hypothetical protein
MPIYIKEDDFYNEYDVKSFHSQLCDDCKYMGDCYTCFQDNYDEEDNEE